MFLKNNKNIKADTLKCITCFLDIERADWSNYNRNVETYINDFLKFYGNIETDLIVFCEENFKNKIIENVNKFDNFESKIQIEIIDRNDLYYFNKLEEIKAAMNSEVIKNQRLKKSSPPEFCKEQYVAITFSKIEIIKIAKDRGLLKDNDAFAWTDFGMEHGKLLDNACEKSISNPNKKRLSNKNVNLQKTTFFQRLSIPLSEDPFYYFSLSDDAIIPAGFFIIPNEKLDEIWYNFKSIIDDTFLSKNIIDDEQTIMAILAKKSPDLVELKSSVHLPNGFNWFPILEYIDE